MRKNVRIWVHGLAAAFIGGGAGSISSGGVVTLVDPDHFRMGSTNQIKVMISSFIFSGMLAAGAYLKQSPLPKIEDDVQ